MIKAAKHTHIKEFEFENSYRMVNDNGEYFVYGEGNQKASKSRIFEIEPFSTELSQPNLEELIDYTIKNKNHTLDYIKNYGFRIIADQYKIKQNDYSTIQMWYFLKHLTKHPDLIDYMSKVKPLYKEFVDLMKKENIPHTEFDLKSFNFQDFCLFDWSFATWQIYIVTMRGDTPLISLLNKYNEHHNLGEVSIKESLNLLSDEDMGDRVESVLNFTTFKHPELQQQ